MNRPACCTVLGMTNTNSAAKFSPRDKVLHERFGIGRIVGVWAIASAADEETEYSVKFRGYRWPATIGETQLRRA